MKSSYPLAGRCMIMPGAGISGRGPLGGACMRLTSRGRPVLFFFFSFSPSVVFLGHARRHEMIGTPPLRLYGTGIVLPSPPWPCGLASSSKT